MKKFFVITIVSIMLFSLADFAFAQNRELEIEYPEIEGEQPEEVTTPVTEYFKYIFNFLIWISGLIALVVLVYAGFQYFTSAGNPEAMNDAKSRIGAALLGILILFGSYLILITINPDLIVFHLPRLRPIISELPAGVLVCREEAEVGRAWQLTNNFKQTEDYGKQKIIAEELEQILEDVSEKCTTAIGKGNITEGVRFVYFIPGEQIIEGERYIALYGAIFYEGENFEGKSQPMYEHLEKGLGMYYPVKYGPGEPIRKITISQLSSIKPFVLIPEHHEKGVQVLLYQEYNKNIGTDLEGKGRTYWLHPTEPYTDTNSNGRWDSGEPYTDINGNGQWNSATWWYEWNDITKGFGSQPGARCEKDFCSPRSIQAYGYFIAILVTPDGRSDTFYNEVDSNLDDNLNIVNWVDCKKYVSSGGTGMGGGGSAWIWTKCAVTAIKKLIIISAKIY